MSEQGNAGRKVGDYEIIREVGRGGMGMVYLARQPGLDRNIALKELTDTQAADRGTVLRFLSEAKLAGSISHPNVVTVYDTFEAGGRPYIAMEYVEGGSLRPYMRNLTLPQFGTVFEGLFAALSEAEAHRIVHRDLKPENLLVTREGRIKVTDFGIAKAKDQLQTTAMMTPAGAAVGTPTYMAPEQAMAQEVGPWTDIYAAGIIAYEALAGRTPYPETTSPMAMLFQHVNETPTPLLSLQPDLDPRFQEWVERLLAKEPINRTRSAQEAWEQLEEIIVDLYGPLWRRQARVGSHDEAVATPAPLTPAPFHEHRVARTPPPLPPVEERQRLAEQAVAETAMPPVGPAKPPPSWAPSPSSAPWEAPPTTPSPPWQGGAGQTPPPSSPQTPPPPMTPMPPPQQTPPPPMTPQPPVWQQPPPPPGPQGPAYMPPPGPGGAVSALSPQKKSNTLLWVLAGIGGTLAAVFLLLVIIGLLSGDDDPDPDPAVVTATPTATASPSPTATEAPPSQTVGDPLSTSQVSLSAASTDGQGNLFYTVRNDIDERVNISLLFNLTADAGSLSSGDSVGKYDGVVEASDSEDFTVELNDEAKEALASEGSLEISMGLGSATPSDSDNDGQTFTLEKG